MVPELRIFERNDAPLRREGEYVLYWMIGARRIHWNFALDRAVEWSTALGKPILVFEALRADYPWANDRFHRFILDGMRDNQAALRGSGIGYYPYVEPEKGASKGLLHTLAERAAVVVTDEFPCFFLPKMVETVAGQLGVKLESVDSNGLLPLAATDRAFLRAFDFRRFLQRELAKHLADFPRQQVRNGQIAARFPGIDRTISNRWPVAAPALLERSARLVELPIDHSVRPIAESGGFKAAQSALDRFLDQDLHRYGTERNHPDCEIASELSGYLHFGHLASHQVLEAVARREQWTPSKTTDESRGRRLGWWNLSEPVESFLDQLVTWRELGYNFCFHRSDYAEFDSLPEWARRTLESHRSDQRPWIYNLEEFESAATHDPIWNSAQHELRARGRIHNYLRMLWGKKILHWSSSPRQAFDFMIELNNKYAIDGRNPNSYSGISWILGRFDRAWGPEREVFGKVRYMSSKNTKRKLRLREYLERWNRTLR